MASHIPCLHKQFSPCVDCSSIQCATLHHPVATRFLSPSSARLVVGCATDTSVWTPWGILLQALGRGPLICIIPRGVQAPNTIVHLLYCNIHLSLIPGLSWLKYVCANCCKNARTCEHCALTVWLMEWWKWLDMKTLEISNDSISYNNTEVLPDLTQYSTVFIHFLKVSI